MNMRDKRLNIADLNLTGHQKTIEKGNINFLLIELNSFEKVTALFDYLAD